MSLATRKEVYKAIDDERRYQDNEGVGPRGRTDGKDKSVGDYITLLDVYVRKAADSYAGNAGNEPALNHLRKIAALAVQAMEVHGAPERVW